MKEQIPVKDIETAEAIAKKLTELGLSPNVQYTSTFEKVGKLRKKVKRESVKVEVSDWLFNKNLEEYRKIEAKLLTIAPSWRKAPLYNGKGISLDADVGKVAVDINIEFPQDQIIPTMSQLLNCEIEEVKQEHPAHTSTSYVCKAKKETTQK